MRTRCAEDTWYASSMMPMSQLWSSSTKAHLSAGTTTIGHFSKSSILFEAGIPGRRGIPLGPVQPADGEGRVGETAGEAADEVVGLVVGLGDDRDLAARREPLCGSL
jgi:hypothetical protein